METMELIEAGFLGKPRRVDAAAGLVEDVKILGLGRGANGNDYSAGAARDAAKLYEGAKVNLNHREKGKTGPRRVEDRFGKFEAVRFVEGEGLRGNLRFNPKGDFGARFAWFAEHMPDAIGMSHNATGRGERRADRFLVESIVSVESVDLVADPSTTKGLFEGKGADGDAGAGGAPADRPAAGTKEAGVLLKEAKIDDVKATRPDLVQAILGEAKSGDRVKDLEEANKKLAADLDTFKAKEAIASKREKAAKLIEETKLPKEAVTDTFMATLLEAKDDAAMKALVEDRKAIVAAAGAKKPVSKEQAAPLTEGRAAGGKKISEMETKDFVRSITRR